MKTIMKLSVVAAASFGLSACATVINGTSQDMEIVSEPSGANVTLSNGVNCVTPCTVVLKRRDDLRADFRKDGYKSEYVYIHSEFGGAAAGNLLLGGLIGGGVDAATGASNVLKPNPMHVRMVRLGDAGEAMLLDKKNQEVSSVTAHNDKVRADVEKKIGPAPAMDGAAQADETSATLVATSDAAVEAEKVSADDAVEATEDAAADE